MFPHTEEKRLRHRWAASEAYDFITAEILTSRKMEDNIKLRILP